MKPGAKKRLLYVLCIAAMTAALAGCSSGGADRTTEAETTTAVETAAETVTEAATEAAAEAAAEAAEASGGDDADSAYGGGSPWIDSDLKEALAGAAEPSPKDDFHLAVNYDWLASADIPDGKSVTSSFSDVELETIQRSQELLENEDLTDHNAVLVRELYSAWLDWDARNKAGMEPAIKTLEDIRSIDSMEALSDFICDTERSWAVRTFANCSNTRALDDASIYITDVANDSLMLSDAAEYQNRTEYGERIYEGSKKASGTLLVRCGYSEDEADAMYDSMITLETSLAEKTLTSEESMDPDIYEKINNVMTLDEVAALAPAFPMERLIRAQGYGDAKQYQVTEPEYFRRLNELYTEENLEAIKAYMSIHYLLSIAASLDQEAFDVMLEYSNTVIGSSGREEDKDYAYYTVQSLLCDPLGQTYQNQYGSEEMKQEITKICEEVISAYRTMLEGESWMTEETRNRAIQKLDTVQIHAVYPDQWYDYSGLSLDGLSLVEMQKAINDFEMIRDQAKTNQKADPNDWDVDILECNAFYDPQNNSINILLGILGGDFYDSQMSEEEIYGGIGTVIGHEISHAFDTNGAQFDENGNLADWWTDEDYVAFREKTDRLAAFYNEIVPWEGETMRGENVQTEAIADIAGMKAILAIAAEKEGFDYDTFFRSYASSWKRVNTPEYEYMCLTQDPHPLAYLRTNVTLQQYDEFLETYEIQPGDGMYLAPEDRITVW